MSLKPCPCGGNVVEEWDFHMKKPHRVLCETCGASSGWYAKEKAARSEWNRRVGAKEATLC